MDVLLLGGLCLEEIILPAACGTWGADQMGTRFSQPASRGVSDVEGVGSTREGGLAYVHRLSFR